MQDDLTTPRIVGSPMADPAPANAFHPEPKRRRGSAGNVLLAMLIAFLIGAGGVAYLAWHGDLSRYLPARSAFGQSSATGGDRSATAGSRQGAAPVQAITHQQAQVVSLESRMAMLEDRFSRLDFEANAASGNAARAESLLIALSARRIIERGEQLGYVSDQLKLRFADAQPKAVDTIIAFSRNPVTLDELGARLEALAPNLTNTAQGNLLARAREELRALFTVHSDSPTLLQPAARIDRARLMLTARRIDNAIDEVERLPGADAAQTWIADARRFDEAERALDLIETTAMLEPRRLRDGSGQEVDQPSPLSTPDPSPTPSTSAVVTVPGA